VGMDARGRRLRERRGVAPRRSARSGLREQSFMPHSRHPVLMKMASSVGRLRVGGQWWARGRRVIGATSPRNSLTWASLRTRYCCPPTAGEHVEQIVFHCDVPHHRPPAVLRRGGRSRLATSPPPGFVIPKSTPTDVTPSPGNHGGLGGYCAAPPTPHLDFRSRL
jgi:hypothetical protein